MNTAIILYLPYAIQADIKVTQNSKTVLYKEAYPIGQLTYLLATGFAPYSHFVYGASWINEQLGNAIAIKYNDGIFRHYLYQKQIWIQKEQWFVNKIVNINQDSNTDNPYVHWLEYLTNTYTNYNYLSQETNVIAFYDDDKSFHNHTYNNVFCSRHENTHFVTSTHADTPTIMNNQEKNQQWGNSDSTLLELVQEYYRLSKLLEPDEKDIRRIEAIYELAQYDSELSSLVSKIDNLIASELEGIESTSV